MFLRVVRLPSRLHKPHFDILQWQSPFSSANPPHPSNDTVFAISAFLKNPDWQRNNYLKSLVSHLSPFSVPKILALHSRDIPLCFKFFKWVCTQSTYCYHIDTRIQLMYLLASYNLHGIVGKVLVYLIRECCSSQDDVLKLIDAIEYLRVAYGFWSCTRCYSLLLMRLAKLGLGLMAFTVSKKMAEAGLVASQIDYQNVINALCKNGYVSAAENLFSRVLKLGFNLDVYIYTSLVLGNCRSGKLNEAFRVFGLMSGDDGCGVNSVAYSILVHGLCESGRLDQACRLKDSMSEKGCRPSTRTYTVLVKAMCDRGLVGQAFGLVNEMVKKGCRLNVYTYTVLVDVLCKEGRIEEANGMFREMLRDGMNPSTETYNALINGYCKEGQVVLAFELLGVMERKHCKPSIRTYNELMEGLCKYGRVNEAVALLRKVIQNGLFPTEVTFNILINGLCREGWLNMALEVLHSMSSLGIEPDQFSYTSLIDTLCKMERPEEAGIILGVIIKKGLSVDEVMQTALIDGYCRTGNIGYAHCLFEKMIKDRRLISPHGFNVFLDVLGKKVNVGMKNAMLGKLLKYGMVPSVVTYTILVDGISRAGNTTGSYIMLDLMRQDSCSPNIYTYIVVVSGLCQSGKVEDAENLLVEMRKDGISPNDVVYAVLVKSHVSTGNLTRALDIVRTMLKSCHRLNAQIYFALLVGCMNMRLDNLTGVETGINCPDDFVFKAMEMCHAFQLIDKIKEFGVRNIDVYKFLIAGLCRVGRIFEVDILIQEMVKRDLTPDSDICDCVIRHFSEKGDYNNCIEWISICGAYGCVVALASYVGVIVGLQAVGRLQEADRLIFDILRNAKGEDRTAILPYLGFLVKGEVPRRSFEFHNLIQQLANRL